MKKNNSSLFVIFVFCWVPISAQQEVIYSLHRYHLNIFNPAATGSQGDPFINMSLRSQWVGIEGAPETQALSIGVPNKNKRIGFGLSIIKDQIFIENQTQFFADFSYNIEIDNYSSLYFGLKAGGTSYRLQANQLNTIQTSQIDPALANTSSFVPNIGAGIYFLKDDFYLSLSVPRLLNSERYSYGNGQTTRATDRPHFFMSTGMRLQIAQNWEFTPSFLVSYVKSAPMNMLIDASLSYDRKFDFGIQYFTSGGIGGITMIDVNEKIKFGYSYTTNSSNRLNTYSKGSHELVFKLKLNNNFF